MSPRKADSAQSERVSLGVIAVVMLAEGEREHDLAAMSDKGTTGFLVSGAEGEGAGPIAVGVG
jgi:hypothetical protein